MAELTFKHAASKGFKYGFGWIIDSKSKYLFEKYGFKEFSKIENYDTFEYKG